MSQQCECDPHVGSHLRRSCWSTGETTDPCLTLSTGRLFEKTPSSNTWRILIPTFHDSPNTSRNHRAFSEVQGIQRSFVGHMDTYTLLPPLRYVKITSWAAEITSAQDTSWMQIDSHGVPSMNTISSWSRMRNSSTWEYWRKSDTYITICFKWIFCWTELL